MTALTNMITALGDFSSTDQDSPGCSWLRQSSAWLIALMMIVIASIVSSLSYTATQDREIGRQVDSKVGLYREAAERIERARQMKNQGVALAAQATFDASLVDAIPRSRALAEVSNAVSAGVHVEQISLAPADPSSTTANLLQINGVAASQAQLSSFVERLSTSQSMRALILRSGKTKASDENSPRDFELTATFDGQTEQAQAAPSVR